MVCIRFYGNLARSAGPELCLELGECVDVLSLVESTLRSRGEFVSLEELLVTSADGKPIPEGATTCEVEEVAVARLVRGG